MFSSRRTDGLDCFGQWGDHYLSTICSCSGGRFVWDGSETSLPTQWRPRSLRRRRREVIDGTRRVRFCTADNAECDPFRDGRCRNLASWSLYTSEFSKTREISIDERKIDLPNIIVFVQVECSWMARHVSMRNLLEDRQIPELLRDTGQIQWDEEIIGVVKDIFLGEILRERKDQHRQERRRERNLSLHRGTEIDAVDMRKRKNILFEWCHHRTKQILCKWIIRDVHSPSGSIDSLVRCKGIGWSSWTCPG